MCVCASEGTLSLLCKKAHYVLRSGPKCNYKRWCEGKGVYLVFDGTGAGRLVIVGNFLWVMAARSLSGPLS